MGGSGYGSSMGGMGSSMYGGGYGMNRGMYGGSGMYGSGGGGMYGGNGMYGGGGGMYSGGGGMYGGAGGGMYGGGGMMGQPMGGPMDPNNPMRPPAPPTAWQAMLAGVNGIMMFFGRLSFLVDENAHAVHFFISALLQLLDRAGSLYAEVARFILRIIFRCAAWGRCCMGLGRYRLGSSVLFAESASFILRINFWCSTHQSIA